MEKKDLIIESVSKEDMAQDKKPLSFGSYLALNLSDEEIDLHTSHIIKQINDILEDPDRKEIMDLAQGWRNQYDGILEEISFPWAGAYNLDTGLTPKIQDAVVAQTQEAFDDVDPRWSVGPVPNKAIMEIRNKQERILDYYEDLEMNNVEDLEGIRHDAFLLGLGWEAVIFEKKYERVREKRNYNNLEKFIKDFPDDYKNYPRYIQELTQGNSITIIVEENQEYRYSPRRKHVEFEDGICPLDAKGVEGVNNANIKGRRIWMKWSDIRELEEEGDYIKGVSDKLRYKSQLEDGKLVEDPEYLNKPYETFEVIYDIYITVNDKKRKIRCLFNVEKEHSICLRAIRYTYDHNHSYLIPHCIKYNRKGLYQDGLGRMLGDIHLAANATISHILNASTLANSLSLKAREGLAARRVNEHRFYPGSVLTLQNLDDVEQFNFATPNLASLISLFAIIERFAQDRSGIVNYQLGVESPEDPEAPASKTIALMRKAEIKLRRYIKNLKRSEDEAGYQSLRLIYQFVPSDKLAEILGEDIEETKDFMRPAMKVITNSSGFAIEKIFTKRDDMAMSQALLKEPLVAQDPEKRVRLWHILAKSAGSNWDKKIIGIVPTPEEIIQEKQRKLQERENKKSEAVKKSVTEVLERGGTEEDARIVGIDTAKKFDAMMEKQETMAAASMMPQENK